MCTSLGGHGHLSNRVNSRVGWVGRVAGVYLTYMARSNYQTVFMNGDPISPFHQQGANCLVTPCSCCCLVVSVISMSAVPLGARGV